MFQTFFRKTPAVRRTHAAYPDKRREHPQNLSDRRGKRAENVCFGIGKRGKKDIKQHFARTKQHFTCTKHCFARTFSKEFHGIIYKYVRIF